MKKVIVSASVIALLVGVLSLAGDAWSQQGKERDEESSPNIPHKIALIDMAHIFKNYKKFEQLREDLKIEITASEDKAKEMQASMLELQKTMKGVQEGSAEFQKSEKQYLQAQANFEEFRRKMGRKFLKDESQIYLQVYNEISSAVKWYAEKNSYTLVMRFSREDLDTENVQALMQGMNKQVVYFRPTEDITMPVLKALERRNTPKDTPDAVKPTGGRGTDKTASGKGGSKN